MRKILKATLAVTAMSVTSPVLAFDNNTSFVDVGGYYNYVETETHGSGNYHSGTHQGTGNQSYSLTDGHETAQVNYQSGRHNYLETEIYGVGHETAIVQQHTGNTAILDNQGFRNKVAIFQNGLGDSADVRVRGRRNTVIVRQ